MTNATELTKNRTQNRTQNRIKNRTKKRSKNRSSKTAGLSMLEVIMVLGFMGIVLLTIATLYRKYIDEKRRQIAADAIAQDVAGLLKFVHTDVIDTQLISNVQILVNSETDPVPISFGLINPLYQQAGASPLLNYQVVAGDMGLANNPLVKVKVKAGNSPQMSPDKEDLLVYMGRYYAPPHPERISNHVEVRVKTSEGSGKDWIHVAGPDETIRVTKKYSHYLNWSEVLFPGETSDRRWFTDSFCEKNWTKTRGVLFSKPFLTCHENPTLANSEIALARVELQNSQGTLPRTTPGSTRVDSVNVYISFKSADGNPAHIWQYVTPLMKAFDKQKIQPNSNERYLVVMASKDSTQNRWEMVNKEDGTPLTLGSQISGARAAKLEDIPAIAGKLKKDGSWISVYGLRFTFDGTGDYLRTDGSNSASKLCWNTQTGTAGPCIIAESEELLAVKTRDNQRYASLHAASIVLDATRSNDDTHQVDEQYTAPRIQYKRFAEFAGQEGTWLAPVYQDPNDARQLCEDDGHGGCRPARRDASMITDPHHGAISLPVQSCPQVQDAQNNPVDMHPRLSVAVSSVASALVKNNDIVQTPDRAHDDVFASQYSAINQLSNRGTDDPQINPDPQGSLLSVNRLGGVVFQIVNVNNPATHAPEWHIAALMNVEDTDGGGHNWQIYNPPWLSVLVTSWCSSEPQP